MIGFLSSKIDGMQRQLKDTRRDAQQARKELQEAQLQLRNATHQCEALRSEQDKLVQLLQTKQTSAAEQQVDADKENSCGIIPTADANALNTSGLSPLMDCASLTVMERFALMAMDRVEHMETEVLQIQHEQAALRQLYERLRKDLAIRAVECCGDKNQMFIDIFLHLAGVKPEARRFKTISQALQLFVPHNLPARALELAALLPCKAPWDVTDIDLTSARWEVGKGLCAVLDAMTLEELERFWKYREDWIWWRHT